MGPPVMRSTLMMRVLPTRAHSVRICRTVTSCASSDTSPFCTDNVRPAAQQGDADEVSSNRAKTSLFIGFRGNPIIGQEPSVRK